MQAQPCVQLPPALRCADRIVEVFDRCFALEFNTRLHGGGSEPFYSPAGQGRSWHLVEFTRDYPASALHEAAHWCLAGEQRRKLPDYGYWYAPDGRDAEQQQLFEQVEAKPQALEWIFAHASGVKFRVSADNLHSGLGPGAGFKRAVWQQLQRYCLEGVNPRAQRFAEALAAEFGRPQPFCAQGYKLADLG